MGKHLAVSAIALAIALGGAPLMAQEPAATDAATQAAAPSISADNPLLATWTGPYGGVPPWDKVNTAEEAILEEKVTKFLGTEDTIL
ncbi:MAG: hypothetical protein AAB227_07845, partial [Pseudomonadota bacterium]